MNCHYIVLTCNRL